MAAPRKPAGPRRARPAPEAASLTAELAAMQAVAAAVEGLPSELAVSALEWVLRRLETTAANEVVDAEGAERDGEEAA